MLNLHVDRRMSKQTRRSCWVLPTVITVPHVATAKGQPAGSPTASHSPGGNGAEICWDHPEFQQSLGICDPLENNPSMISINFLWFLKKFYFPSFYPIVFPVYPISVPSQGPQPPGSSCNPSRPFHVTAFAAFNVSAALGVDAALELRRELRAEALRGSAVAEVVRGCMAHAAGGWWLGGKAWVVVWFCKVGYIIWLVEWLWLLNYCYNYIYIYLARC